MNFFVYLLALALSGILKLLPWSTVKAIAAIIGATIYYIIPFRRKVVISNIERTLKLDASQTKKTARAAYINTVRVFLETMKFTHSTPLLGIEGEEHLKNALNKGKGVMIITGHIGNWELAGSLSEQFAKSYAVGRKIKNPYMDKWIRQNRQRRGLEPIYKTSTSASNRQIIKALKNNSIVFLVIDQYRPGGQETEFMGIKTKVPQGPYRLAKLTGAAVIPAFMPMRKDGTYTVICRPEIEFVKDENKEQELAINTYNYMQAIEHMIRSYPEQWFWFHNRFKKSPKTES